MLVTRSIGGNREAWGSPHASFYESWKEERWASRPNFQCCREFATSSLRSPADLGLDLYDLEQRGGTLRVTLDTPAGSESGVTLDVLALASRLMSKELDQHDPIPFRYTLEVTSPGVERALRTSAHFQREIGKLVADSSGKRRSRPASGAGSDRRRRRRRRHDPRRRRRPTHSLRRHRPGQDRVRMGWPAQAGFQATSF